MTRAALLCLLLCPAAAAAFGVKDLEIGKPIDPQGDVGSRVDCRAVTACEYLWPQRLGANKSTLTLGGVEVAHLRAEIVDGVVDTVFVQFAASAFDVIRDGLQGKYPGLICADSTVQNQRGAKFPQTSCRTENAQGVLYLFRRGSNVDAGDLHILSRSALERRAAQRSRQKGNF